MAEIISFRKNPSPLGASFKGAEPVVGNGPEPNFEDPHSAKFFPEPRIDKRLCDFLPYSDQQLLLRMQHARDIKIEINNDERTIALFKKADFSKVADGQIRSLFEGKPSYLKVADIECSDPKAARGGFRYTISATGQSEHSVHFGNLMDKLMRHLDTGSPNLPEPEFWR